MIRQLFYLGALGGAAVFISCFLFYFASLYVHIHRFLNPY